MTDFDRKKALEVITIGIANKTAMLKAGETRRTIGCPRCGGRLHFALAGRKNHLRMGCEGKCGMEAME